MSMSSQFYSYSSKGLVASYESLKSKESELLEQASQDAPMQSSPFDGKFVVAAIQLTGADLPQSDMSGYCFRAEQAIEQAVSMGAHLILLSELWSGPYFCQSQEAELMQLADTVEESILVRRMQQLAKLFCVVLPISIYERKNNAYYNSVVMIDSDGSIVGTYRKSHIPDGPGYQEKFYFTPGDTGFRVFDTSVGKVGVAICWDQWFPETARALALQGAEVILYPTAIGSEPQNPTLNSADHWQRVMQGHAAANMVPIVASNRFGTEILLREDGTEKQRIAFYGRSFITDNTGLKIAECSDNTEDQPVVVVKAEVDRKKNQNDRAAWGLFRDRRPDLYEVLLTKDGNTRI